MSNRIGNFWGFEARNDEAHNRFNLLQFRGPITTPPLPPVSAKILENLPTIQPAVVVPAAPPLTISIGNGSGFIVSLPPLPETPHSNNQTGAGLLGGTSPLQTQPSVTSAPTIQIPQALVAASGDLHLNHDLLSGLVKLFTSTSTPANTQSSESTRPQQASTATPPNTTHAPHPSGPSQTHAAPTQAQTTSTLNIPAATAQPSDTNRLTINPPRDGNNTTLDQGFQKLPSANKQELISTLRSAVERNLFSQFKATNKQTQDGIRTTINSLLTKLQADTLPSANDKSLSGVAQKAVEMIRQIAEPIVQKTLQSLKKDSFNPDNRYEVYRQVFTPTSRSNLGNVAGPRTFWQAAQSPAYPSATHTSPHGPQTQNPTHASQQQPMHSGLPGFQGGPLGNQNPAFPANSLAGNFQQSATNAHSDPYASPFQLGLGRGENDNDGRHYEDVSQNRAFGDSRDSHQEGQQDQQRSNGLNIDDLMTPEGVLKPLDVKMGIQVVKFFYRRSGRTHLLDTIYDNQTILNPQASPINRYLYSAATDQSFYNQYSHRSSGQVMQIMLGDINKLSIAANDDGRRTSTLTPQHIQAA